MDGCMSWLKKMKEKKGDFPLCRAKIDQVLRLYVILLDDSIFDQLLSGLL
ncbi:putative E3 ubiquitin-protein ligase XBOS34 [Dendrobium catenatum]|uniref:Putative E3 ubiquitin-protein ligase XBOS34 n=1 Tax=Dendrobium catenatum TaxID=906689 RepID=A0A2I0WKF1_9ASPA|nr:putative E3 ubiquitin-protein ligase XBOS34 [Dendrobium catenatum]